MTITAEQLVLQSYHTSNILDPDEPMLGYQAEVGLQLLNSIIDEWSGLAIYIPTYTVYTFPTIANEYMYINAPPIIQFLEGNTIDSNNVQWSLTEIDLKTQNLLNYPLSLTSPTRPKNIFIQNSSVNLQNQNSTIFLYQVPDQVYTVTLYLKIALTRLTQSQVIIDIPPRSMKALRYQLVKDISLEYEKPLTPDFMDEYKRLMRNLRAANKRDLTVRTRNIFSDRFARFRPYGSWNW